MRLRVKGTLPKIATPLMDSTSAIHDGTIKHSTDGGACGRCGLRRDPPPSTHLSCSVGDRSPGGMWLVIFVDYGVTHPAPDHCAVHGKSERPRNHEAAQEWKPKAQITESSFHRTGHKQHR